MVNKKLNILFVCRYNRFRSRVAKSYFKKINNNPLVKVKSAGLIKGNPLNSWTVRYAKEMGLDIRGKTCGLSSKLMAWQNITIIVADNVPPQVFDRNKKYGKKVIVLKIKDVNSNGRIKIRTKIKEVMNKVDKLKVSLEKELK